MANNIENDSKEILSAISDMSFLPKEAKDENEGREFLKLNKKEGLFRLIWTLIVAAAGIAYLVCLFYFGVNGYYFSSQVTGSYGIWGLIVTAIFALFFCLNIGFNTCYDKELSNLKEAQKVSFYHKLNISSYYVSFFLLYATFFSTILRPFVFQKYFFGENGFAQNLGWFMIVVIFILSALGIVLTFLKPEIGKVYNISILALGNWIVICFSSLLTKNYAMSSNYGIMMLIFGAIFSTLSVPFLLLQKKYHGMKSAFNVMLSFSFVFEVLAVLIYGIAQLGA